MKLQPGSLLKPFLQNRIAELNKAKAKLSMGQKQGKVSELPMCRGFQGAVMAQFNATGKPGVIAELKGGSPFDKSLKTSVPYKPLAEDFEAVGAICLSVAVERKIFGGSYSDLATVHDAVKLPLLAQDIIFDIYQILEVRLAGGDAVMLPVSILGDQVGPYIERTISVALDPIVQVHTKAELDKVLAYGATCICVTNRNIHTFELVPDRCDELLPLIPPERAVAIAEGGFGTLEDLERLGKAGAKAVMMGTALMRDEDPAGVLEKVLGLDTLPTGELPADEASP
jgi:indole-3-glycerol phosphate synthase